MKHITSIISIIIYTVLVFALIAYTFRAVNSGNICETIYGCFGMWVWLNIGKRENKR